LFVGSRELFVILSIPSFSDASAAHQQKGTQMAHSLIAADRVDGTAVYGTDQNKIGSIEHVMIDKISGKIAYAVLSFGGFLGIGDEHYPLPWSSLKYDTNLDGYRVNLTKDQLEKAPRYNQSEDWDWSRDNDRRVYDYYKAAPYW
jgi:hypothetical protein